MINKILIGNDIGGSHITSMAVDFESHKIMTELCVRNHVDSQAPASDILDAWTQTLEKMIGLIGAVNLGGIGFAMPGPFDYPSGLALFSGVKKYDSLYGINVKDELVKRLGLAKNIPVRFLNDATCFAIGEAWIGQASAYKRTMAITLGTGFGSAFLDDGIPVESGDDVPESGCVYHLPFGNSIADDHFSTRWFCATYKEKTGKVIEGVKEIASQPGNAAVQQIFNEFGTNLGNFLSPWLNRFNAGCLTLGGNIANSYDLFRDAFLNSLEQGGCYTKVFISDLGELSAIAGSARLCDDTFYSRLPFISSK